MPLLPENDIEEASQYLRSIKPVLYEKEIDLFLEYYDKTYGLNSNFPPPTIEIQINYLEGHYRNVNPRTINYLIIDGKKELQDLIITFLHASICLKMNNY